MIALTRSMTVGFFTYISNRIGINRFSVFILAIVFCIIIPVYSFAFMDTQDDLAREIEQHISIESSIYGYIQSVRPSLTHCTLRIVTSYAKACSRSTERISTDTHIKLDELIDNQNYVIVGKYSYAEGAVLLSWPLNRPAEKKRAHLSSIFRNTALKHSLSYNGMERILNISNEIEPLYDAIGLATRSYVGYCGGQKAIEAPTRLFTHIFNEGSTDKLIRLISNYTNKFCVKT